jgi:hypothetical protein
MSCDVLTRTAMLSAMTGRNAVLLGLYPRSDLSSDQARLYSLSCPGFQAFSTRIAPAKVKIGRQPHPEIATLPLKSS